MEYKLSNQASLLQPLFPGSTTLDENDPAFGGIEDKVGKPGLGPIEKPPYYALPLYAGGPNTKGGVAANAKREVLDWEGQPIPRLYTAGEISSALKFVYQAGGNLSECIVMGRIAGKNAAAVKPWA